MRVVSLLPAATEMVAALGALPRLVGVSHECDYPPETHALPRVTRTRLDPSLPSAEIARAMPAARRPGTPPRELSALAPDLVVVALCGFDVARAQQELAAVTDRDARALLGRRVEFMDGNAYTSRPGPRLVDAAEILARLIAG